MLLRGFNGVFDRDRDTSGGSLSAVKVKVFAGLIVLPVSLVSLLLSENSGFDSEWSPLKSTLWRGDVVESFISSMLSISINSLACAAVETSRRSSLFLCSLRLSR